MAGPLRAGLPGLSAALTLGPRLASACAVCIGPGAGDGAGSAGFYWSAWLLTALPFAVVLTVGGAIGYSLRRGRRRTTPDGTGSPGPRPR